MFSLFSWPKPHRIMKEINLLHEARLDSNAPLLFAALLPHFERNYKYNTNDRITERENMLSVN